MIPRSKISVQFVIVGGGIGGLSAAIGVVLAGHKAVVLERAKELSEVGAGIQIPPNSTRILEVLGCKEAIIERALVPKAYHFYNYKGDNLISLELDPYCAQRYGCKSLHIHRGDFHKCLVSRCRELNIPIMVDSEIETVDFETNTAITHDGRKFKGDIIVGADGLNSKIRNSLVGRYDPPRNSGDQAYRSLISIPEMEKYPELDFIHKIPCVNFFWGPQGHVVTYPLKGGNNCNVVVMAPDNLVENASVVPAEQSEVQEILKEWDPRLKLLLSLARGTFKWRLQSIDQLDSWNHLHANVTLLGDACHATLPYLAQGAAQAIEDAAALSYLFGKLDHKSDIHSLLQTYEDVRKPRATRIVESSAQCQNIYHLPDGQEQEVRDLLCAMDPPEEGCPARWADPVFQEYLFGYNVFEECEKAWANKFNHSAQVRSAMTKTGDFHAILVCDVYKDYFAPFGDQGDITSVFFKKNGLKRPTKKYHAVLGDLPTPYELELISSIHITGAAQCPYGNDPWVLDLVAFVKDIIENHPSIKMTGCCYGHQIICRAMGGLVTPSSNGIEAGICEIKLADDVPKKLLDPPVPGKVFLVEAHKNWVKEAPENVLVIGSSDKTHIQGVYRKGRFLTLQGHPEFPKAISETIVEHWIKKDCSKEFYDDCVKRNKLLPNDEYVLGSAMVNFLLDDTL
ncbi:hypothetical protein OGAPHI_000189 [Ogataea philodendri]|uniref:FAD-binding domain-containing protein n=1 Tax=Ogataea philodendri TaxID=1378263 RepID=A0A9P8PHR0_9ASCO|nr:uncharacterized protein OGAPHI_000189 [Ogataea philodendri]KAH3671487.1 hypothetical protein OGAPHI_000189 [Ogataea philodendri]